MNDVERIKKAYSTILKSLGPEQAEEFMSSYDKERLDARCLLEEDLIHDSMAQATRCVAGGLGLSERQVRLLIRCSGWCYSLSSVQEVNSRYLVSLLSIAEGSIKCGVEFSDSLLDRANAFFKFVENHLDVGVALINKSDFPSESFVLGEISSSFRRLQSLLPKWVSRDMGRELSDLLNFLDTIVGDREKFERVCLPFSTDLMKLGARGFSLRFKRPAFWPVSKAPEEDLDVSPLNVAGMTLSLDIERDGIYACASDDISTVSEYGYDKVHNCYLEISKIGDMLSAIERARPTISEGLVDQTKLVLFLPSGRSNITVGEAEQARDAMKIWRSDAGVSKLMKIVERAYGDI